MKKPKDKTVRAITEIPASVTKIDIQSGKETNEPMSWKIIPPGPGKCAVCAQVHEADEPHNAQTMYYQIIFQNMIGRAPTWADAMAHCPDGVKAKWKAELVRRGVWSEPPKGEQPVAHHGVE